MSKKLLLRVTTANYVAGAEFERDQHGNWVCVKAAPIIGWMYKVPPENIKDWLRRNNHSYEWIKIEA